MTAPASAMFRFAWRRRKLLGFLGSVRVRGCGVVATQGYRGCGADSAVGANGCCENAPEFGQIDDIRWSARAIWAVGGD